MPRRWLRWTIAAALTAAIFGTLPLERFLAAPLVSRVPPPSPREIAATDGMIVLAGEYVRFIEATRLATTHTALPLLLITPEVERVRRLTEEAGIDMRRLTFETRSHSTQDDATLAREFLSPGTGAAVPGCWLLVTSASHMPRAQNVFRRTGIEVVPYPVQSPPDRDSPLWWTAREWLALIDYWHRGRTDSLLPRYDPTHSCAAARLTL